MPETTEQPTPKPRDFRQEVTDNIVSLLEKGVAPWQKPWDAQSNSAMPVNPTTDRAYRGGNAVHLLAVGIQRNYEDPRWMTYKQASERGWQVKRGERGTQIEFWDVKPQREDSTNAKNKEDRQGSVDRTKADDPASRLVHRVYTVFNANQIDGVPALIPREIKPFEAVEAGERMLANSGAKVHHDQADSAFYSRQKDEIHLPPQQAFKDAAGYYGTALHELGHWTGHPSRLNRWTMEENYKFGDTRYAKEELRAELASVFLAAEKGIPHDPQNHAAYVGSWIQALKQDKNEIFRAAHDASKAADLLLSMDREVSIADQKLETDTPELEETRAEAVDLERVRDTLSEQLTQQPVDEILPDSDSLTGPFKPGDKAMVHEPLIPGSKSKANQWSPAVVESLYSNDQYLSYLRPGEERAQKSVEHASSGTMRYANPEELKEHETEFAILEQRLPLPLREELETEKKTQTDVQTRESTKTAARHEPESGVVSITDKANGTERRTQVASPDVNNGSDARAKTITDQLKEASALAGQLLGENAKVKPATLISGNYRGPIVAETPEILFQRLSPKSMVIHDKDLFNEAPKVGANVAINYSNGNPSVRPIKERARAVEMSR